MCSYMHTQMYILTYIHVNVHTYVQQHIYMKGKVIPLQAWCGLDCG